MKRLISLLCLAAGVSFGSVIGIDALGEEQVAGGSAAAAARGFAGNAKTGDAEGVSVVNPARVAFDNKVSFNLNFLIEMDAAENHGHNYAGSNVSMPSLNMSFPMGSFGAMGVSLWQHYASTMREEFEDEASSTEGTIEYKGSVYEIVPTYAVRLPFWRSLSLGGSGHFVLGNASRSLTLGGSKADLDSTDRWGVSNFEITDYVEGSWEIEDHPAYYTLALQYRGKQASYFFSYTTGYTLKNDLKYNFRFNELDTLKPTESVRRIEVPAMFATGVNYRFNKRHNVMLDLQWRAWDEDIENLAGSWNMVETTKTQSDFMMSLGYQCDGSPLFYDPYLKRINYRAGAWYKNWYVEDVFEIGGSLGAGFPLGRKGIMFDLALQGGKRFADVDNEWDEMFFAIRIGLTGIGNWGQSRR